MATLYMVSLEERAEIARHQLELVILRLRSVGGQSRPEDIDRALSTAITQLEHISELIGR